MFIYLAAPLFSEAERRFNSLLRDLLEARGFQVFLPQEDSNNSEDIHLIFRRNLSALERAEVVVAVLEGADVDSGTAWEVGYALGQGKPVVGLRTDFRTLGREGRVNLMIGCSLKSLFDSASELVDWLTDFAKG